jgi:hypothetical protein
VNVMFEIFPLYTRAILDVKGLSFFFIVMVSIVNNQVFASVLFYFASCFGGVRDDNRSVL